ncbi:unnamed protein product [Porites lobata]|uniref:Peroxidase n=1 Tax=Porites lobata TaxID=104759 RepID=A0ABN8NWF2_9CNID|nr:unnamed protein product [Porites lobata]
MMLVLLVLAVGLSTLTRSCSARIDISNSDPLDDCGSIVLQVNCSSISSEYRHITGACNNLNYPSLGAAMTPFRRLIPKRERKSLFYRLYSTSCVFSFQVNMNELPNARSVSRELFPQNAPPSNPAEESPESTLLTDMAGVFGQFLTHDITLTWHKPSSSKCNDCFNPGTECFGINVTSDVIFSARKCIQMKRATRCQTANAGQEQVNIATTFIDASHIYGNNDDEVRIARAGDPMGKLWQENDLLPPAREKKPFCRSPNPGTMPCFYTGDFRRNNVSPALNVLHTIWVREHNRIARKLKQINTGWNGEKVFQETRKILGAMMQHITYNEYLPALLSRRMRRQYGLVLKSGGFYTGYDASVDPSIANSFATAALRYGHSTVGNIYKPCIPTADFHNPAPLYAENGVDAILRGLLYQPAREVDRYCSSHGQSLRNSSLDQNLIADLVAINIQRGRDHGLPAFGDFNAHFDVNNVNIPGDLKNMLKELYGSDLSKVDLYVGGLLLENPTYGSHVGPTFAHILAEGFRNLRKGDRFWYETNEKGVGFSLAQLTEIRKVSLARIVCDNSGISYVQPKVMKKRNWRRNRKVKCDSLPEMDLTKWIDRSVPVIPRSLRFDDVPHEKPYINSHLPAS